MLFTKEKILTLLADYAARNRQTWDSLWQRRSIGRIAISVTPNEETLQYAKQLCSQISWEEPDSKPVKWTPEWRQNLLEQIAVILAGLLVPGDGSKLSLGPPRFVHGQSQGICDLFGARVESQPDGNYFVHPLSPDKCSLKDLKVKELSSSLYWGAVDYIRYARLITGDIFCFGGPVMTSSFDTTNYLLSTTVLMEWVYTEKETLHSLLNTVTDTIIAMLGELQQAAGGAFLNAPYNLGCQTGAFGLCSECRSLVSAEIYEEFEAPYLRRIGEKIGPYSIHSCGSWERTVPSAIADPNLRQMQGQIRENDLAALCKLSSGRMTFGIGPSINLPPRYTWQNMESYYAFILQTVPSIQPLGISVAENDLALWNRLCDDFKRPENKLPLYSLRF